ncbi:unnamed protein product [Trichobilharzia szidati]|nr:unnamed protein product [Trichobilharzia szidati]
MSDGAHTSISHNNNNESADAGPRNTEIRLHELNMIDGEVSNSYQNEMEKFENANQTAHIPEMSQEMLNKTQKITKQNLRKKKTARKETDKEFNQDEVKNVTTGKQLKDPKKRRKKPIPENPQNRQNQSLNEKRRKTKKPRNKRKKKTDKTLSQSEDGKTTQKLESIDYSTENAFTEILTSVTKKYENQINTESTKDEGEKFSEKLEMETKEQQKITSDTEGGVTESNQYSSVDYVRKSENPGENITAHHKETETDQSNEDELSATTELGSAKQSENQQEMSNEKVTEDIEKNNQRIETEGEEIEKNGDTTMSVDYKNNEKNLMSATTDVQDNRQTQSQTIISPHTEQNTKEVCLSLELEVDKNDKPKNNSEETNRKTQECWRVPKKVEKNRKENGPDKKTSCYKAFDRDVTICDKIYDNYKQENKNQKTIENEAEATEKDGWKNTTEEEKQEHTTNLTKEKTQNNESEQEKQTERSKEYKEEKKEEKTGKEGEESDEMQETRNETYTEEETVTIHQSELGGDDRSTSPLESMGNRDTQHNQTLELEDTSPEIVTLQPVTIPPLIVNVLRPESVPDENQPVGTGDYADGPTDQSVNEEDKVEAEASVSQPHGHHQRTPDGEDTDENVEGVTEHQIVDILTELTDSTLAEGGKSDTQVVYTVNITDGDDDSVNETEKAVAIDKELEEEKKDEKTGKEGEESDEMKETRNETYTEEEAVTIHQSELGGDDRSTSPLESMGNRDTQHNQTVELEDTSPEIVTLQPVTIPPLIVNVLRPESVPDENQPVDTGDHPEEPTEQSVSEEDKVEAEASVSQPHDHHQRTPDGEDTDENVEGVTEHQIVDIVTELTESKLVEGGESDTQVVHTVNIIDDVDGSVRETEKAIAIDKEFVTEKEDEMSFSTSIPSDSYVLKSGVNVSLVNHCFMPSYSLGYYFQFHFKSPNHSVSNTYDDFSKVYSTFSQLMFTRIHNKFCIFVSLPPSNTDICNDCFKLPVSLTSKTVFSTLHSMISTCNLNYAVFISMSSLDFLDISYSSLGSQPRFTSKSRKSRHIFHDFSK